MCSVLFTEAYQYYSSTRNIEIQVYLLNVSWFMNNIFCVLERWYISYIITHHYNWSFYILFDHHIIVFLVWIFLRQVYLVFLSLCLFNQPYFFSKWNWTILLLWWKCWFTNNSTEYLMIHLQSFYLFFHLYIWSHFSFIVIYKETITPPPPMHINMVG